MAIKRPTTQQVAEQDAQERLMNEAYVEAMNRQERIARHGRRTAVVMIAILALFKKESASLNSFLAK
jgi:hypothetical protein